MKKQGEFDLDAECKFSDLPSDLAPEEIKTVCTYEYMRESKALTNALSEPSIAPYVNDLYCSCKTDCVREYHPQKKRAGVTIEYQISCPHCDNVVPLPLTAGDHWERQFDEYCSAGLVRPSFAREFNWDATYRLVLALRQAGFPKPWKTLKDDAQQELIRAISNWDEERKKTYPPVVIEPGFERDLERNKSRVLVSRSGASNLSSLSFIVGNGRGENTSAVLFGLMKPTMKLKRLRPSEMSFENAGRRPEAAVSAKWRARLSRLAVMRIWKYACAAQNGNDYLTQWKRVKLIAKLCGYKGCIKEYAKYQERCKQGRGDWPMTETASEEMSRARAEARKFFQRLFPNEEPLSD
jgi:hypothetical protein